MTDYTDTDKYKILDGGAIYSKEEGRIVAHLPGEHKYSITKANAGAMVGRWHELRKAKSLRSQLQGHIDGVREYWQGKGIALELPNPDELTDEELISVHGSAERFIAKVFTTAFLKAAENPKNFRGLSEGYSKINEPTTRGPQAEVHHTHDVSDGVATALLEALREALQPQAIDGKVIE
jgi:hypothetical protein